MVSYTGSDLVGAPGVSFPTTTPTISGSSIVFGSSSRSFGELVAIDLSAIGLVPPSTNPVQLTVSINLTRLPCSTELGCAGDMTDWDPAVMLLDDDHNMFGTQLNDPGQVFAEEQKDVGGSGQRLVHSEVRLDFDPTTGAM